MNNVDRFRHAFAGCPLVAILRGLTPEEAPAIGDALAGVGFTLIEVPLNSPDPFASIRILSERLADRAMIGAGTVLDPQDVDRVSLAGGRLIISPNADDAVIARTTDRGLVSMPGYYTATEAFAALRAGAHALKLFPADATPPATLKAQRAVLPRDVPVLAVGGITPDRIAPWRAAGADGFGLGSHLYSPGRSANDVAAAAAAYISSSKGTS